MAPASVTGGVSWWLEMFWFDGLERWERSAQGMVCIERGKE